MSKTIGRTIGRYSMSASNGLKDADLSERVIKLMNGREIVFSAKQIPSDLVETLTYVDPDINGRDQATLTPDSVAKIRESIKYHQWFPVIARWNESKTKIEILDGSRRRLSAILEGVALDVLIEDSDEPLTIEEAKLISQEIQTAKEHSMRDLGMSLLPLAESGKKQSEIAELRGLSQSKVSRALTAAKVPQSIVLLFPDPNELVHIDYINLQKISDLIGDSEAMMLEIKEAVTNSVPIFSDLGGDEIKSSVLSLIKKVAFDSREKKEKPKVKVSHLVETKDKNQFARKRVNGEKISYEFSRIGKQIQLELDEAILKVLNKHHPVK